MKKMIMWDKYDNKYREVVDVEVARGLESDLYEANNRIDDLLDIVKDKDKLIKQLCIGIREHDSLEDVICPLTEPLDCHDINKDGTCIDCIIEYYKRGVSNEYRRSKR